MKTAAEMVHPILKQGCRTGKLQRKWYAPACKEAAVLKDVAKMLKWPSLKLGWGIGRLPQNGMPQPYTRLGHWKTTAKMCAPAYNGEENELPQVATHS